MTPMDRETFLLWLICTAFVMLSYLVAQNGVWLP
jgi:hypothetical protein